MLNVVYFLSSAGLEYILEVRNAEEKNGEKCEYFCLLCNGTSLLYSTVLAHVKSLPHRIKFIVS